MQFDRVPEEVTVGPRYGLTAGLTADFAFNRSVGLSVRGSYSQKGQTSQWSEEGLMVEVALDADYVELAVLLTAHPGGGPFRLLAGPAVAFSQKCTVSGTASFGGETESQSLECGAEEFGGAEIAGTDLGLIVGAGLAVGDGIRYSLDFLYALGLGDVAEQEEESAKHRGATVVAGLSFPLGRR